MPSKVLEHPWLILAIVGNIPTAFFWKIPSPTSFGCSSGSRCWGKLTLNKLKKASCSFPLSLASDPAMNTLGDDETANINFRVKLDSQTCSGEGQQTVVSNNRLSCYEFLTSTSHAQNIWISREASKPFPLPNKSATRKGGAWASSVNESCTAMSLKLWQPFQILKRSIMPISTAKARWLRPVCNASNKVIWADRTECAQPWVQKKSYCY